MPIAMLSDKCLTFQYKDIRGRESGRAAETVELVADPVPSPVRSSLPPISVQERLLSVTLTGEAQTASPAPADQCCHWLLAATEPNGENC